MTVALSLASLASTAKSFADEPVAEEAVPRRIAYADSQKTVPLWVDARELSDPEATDGVDWSLVEPHVRDMLLRSFARDTDKRRANPNLAADDCTSFFAARQYDLPPAVPGSYRDDRSFKGLSSGALGIYYGIARGSTEGLADGSPGSLTYVEITEVVRASGGIEDATHLYVFLRFAKFKAGKKWVCARDSQYPKPPQSGEKILLFAFWPPRDKGRSLIVPEARHLIIEKASGNFDLSQALRTDLDILAADSLEELVSFVERNAEP